jgi:hypothetical protein
VPKFATSNLNIVKRIESNEISLSLIAIAVSANVELSARNTTNQCQIDQGANQCLSIWSIEQNPLQSLHSSVLEAFHATKDFPYANTG